MSSLQLHLVNTLLVLLEHAVSAVPVRVLHVLYPIIYGVIYMIFSLVYWTGDHRRVMYDILDWNKPAATVGFVMLIGFVVVPVIHLAIYGLYRIRLATYKKICQR